MFSGPVKDVSRTKIFARQDGKNRQYLAYSMNFESARSVAMILPIPVSSHAEDAVQFIDLSGYPSFFDDMYLPFAPASAGAPGGRFLDLSGAVLTVHDVGEFIASFVPSLPDFNRLDDRFKLPQSVWDKLPIYSDYGFCVFQFKNDGTDGEKVSVHPMAFSFPTRHTDLLFFPTVHVHDGAVHEQEYFDHALYFQGGHFTRDAERSAERASFYMDTDKASGIVDPDAFLYRGEVTGLKSNVDIWVPAKRSWRTFIPW